MITRPNLAPQHSHWISSQGILLLCLLIFSFLGGAKAQNLVLNPSFENHTQIPCNYSQLALLANWFSPSIATPDAFSTLNALSCIVHLPTSSVPSSVGQTIFGTELPRTGNFCAGILTFERGCITGASGFAYREYVQGRLSSPLIVGVEYCVEFWVSCADSFGLFTNNLGAYLSVFQPTRNDCQPLGVIPQINETNIIRQYEGWYKVSGSYVATTPDAYITIGNHFDENNTLKEYNYTTIPHSSPAYTQNGYYFIDDVSVVPNIAPQIAVSGADTVCPNASGTLTATGAASYAWWELGNPTDTLSVSNVLNVSVPTTTSFVVAGRNCDYATLDTVTLHVYTLAGRDLGPDRYHCLGSSISDTLALGGSFQSYAWSNGATTATVVVTSMGTYTVTVTDTLGCTLHDTIVIEEMPLGLPASLTKCGEATLLLDVGMTLQNPVWQDTIQSDTFRVATESLVWVAGLDSLGCLRQDTIAIIHRPSLELAWPQDSLFCENALLSLSGYPEIDMLQWSNGDTALAIEILASGWYAVAGFDLNGCAFQDSIQIALQTSSIALGPDHPYCDPVGITLAAPGNAAVNLWSDGSQGTGLQVTSPGIYWLRSTTREGCIFSDTVHFTRCDEPPMFPNVFTPNGDGIHDFYQVTNPLPIIPGTFKFQLFDRWGHALFTSSDPQFRWDGKVGGADVPDGCYFWVCNYIDVSKDPVNITGIVSVFR
jgi:gliding motility-associated-like protein